MLPLRPTPEPPALKGRGGSLFLVWLVALAVIGGAEWTRRMLHRVSVSTGLITFVEFLALLVLIALTLYGFALAVRWLMRALFWRVGRRLFLSYLLIGLLPFFLFAILLLTMGDMVAGVMSHAALRNERQASLGQMESAALEYGLTGKKPADALPTLEIYDTDANSSAKLPDWLKETTFSGMAWRDGEPLLVASRQFPRTAERPRTVVFVQPIDKTWIDQLHERAGMIIRVGRESDTGRKNKVNMKVEGSNVDFNADDGDMEDLIVHSIGRKIIWGDLTSLNDWKSGGSDDEHQLFTLIINPVSSLFQFYFGAGPDQYVRILFNVITSLSVMLLFIYMMAALFAAVLIYSITRAVNRIEKGTKAVERGDFSYRIDMKPHNQLGEMAQSFDRMTESIALVHGSTEKRAFMTLAFTTFDLERGVIRHTNAGHLYPYLLRNGQPPTSIELPSLPLGVRPKIRTRTVEVSLEEGDTLVYLSDGIIEAQNEHGDPFGFEQLEALLKQAEDTSPNTVRDAILQAVSRHSGSRPADDDRTVMVLRFDRFRSAVTAAPELTEATAV